MVIVTVEVKAPGWAAQGIKEHLAMLLEGYGDTRVVEVREESGEQPPRAAAKAATRRAALS